MSSQNENPNDVEIIFSDETVVVDRQDAKTTHSMLKQTDNQSYVCYRKDNKIAIICHVKPKCENSKIEVILAFIYFFYYLLNKSFLVHIYNEA